MTPDVLIIVAFILGLVGITSILVVKNLLYICQPNEVLIFTGSKRKVGDEVLGYRIVKGGRAVRMPLIEAGRLPRPHQHGPRPLHQERLLQRRYPPERRRCRQRQDRWY